MIYQLPIENKKYCSCAITGHRSLPIGFDREKVKQFLRTLIEKGVEKFYNGLAIGFDLLTAELIVELKREYPKVKLYGCVPFYGQERYYNQEDKLRYQRLLNCCEEVTVLNEEYHKGSYFQRNDYMIEKADVLFAYCKEEKGGTAYTVRLFAKRKGIQNVLFFE